MRKGRKGSLWRKFFEQCLRPAESELPPGLDVANGHDEEHGGVVDFADQGVDVISIGLRSVQAKRL